MTKKLAILFLALILSSCTKDKLIGERAILIGKWNWTQTNHTFGICEGDNYTEILTPLSEGETFSMEFFEKGIVKFYQNNELLSTDRLIIKMYPSPCSGDLPEHKAFYIYLNNKDDYEALFYGCIDDNDIVVVKGFPFNLTEETGCDRYTSYFVRE